MLTQHTPGGPLQFVGTVNETANVTIAGQPAVVDPTNTFRGPAPTVNGTTRVSITATDPSGNAASKQYDVDVTGAPKTFTYDANGNMTGDGTRTFEWDAKNQLMAMVTGTRRDEYGYDGVQRRVKSVVRQSGAIVSAIDTVWCGTRICEDRTGMSSIQKLFPMGRQSGSAASFFAGDHLVTATTVTDSVGQVVSRQELDPWGRRTIVTGVGVQEAALIGHRWSAAGELSLAMFRGFTPELGRWLTEDPAGGVDGPNQYGYGRNNPVTSSDPLGLMGVVSEIVVNIVEQSQVGGTAVAGSKIGARFDCSCSCAGGGNWRLNGLLIVTGTMNLPKDVQRTPCVDKSVHDTESARTHEYVWHINPGIEATRRFVKPFEDKVYSSEPECKGQCAQLKGAAPSVFLSKVHATQVQEVQRCGR